MYILSCGVLWILAKMLHLVLISTGPAVNNLCQKWLLHYFSHSRYEILVAHNAIPFVQETSPEWLLSFEQYCTVALPINCHTTIFLYRRTHTQ